MHRRHGADLRCAAFVNFVKEFHFCVIFPAKKFVLSMIIHIFAATESATLPI